MEREKMGSRLGFILISAGCAIGLGNVWRFPYIVGQYGGAAFVLLILVFLAIVGLPILVMEYANGRASRRGIARSYDVLEPAGAKWHRFKWAALAGNFLLLMFYTVICGFMLAYTVRVAIGAFEGLDAAGASALYDALSGNPVESIAWMLVTVAASVAVTYAGVQGGLERISKVMMAALFVILLLLCAKSLLLPGAAEGLSFYLMPDFGKLFAGDTPAEQWATFGSAVYAAMGQAFFMVSVGMGSMTIFGSYIGKERRLTGEAVNVLGLNTLVAILTGLVIFPSCFTYGVEPGSGPGLVFVTLPTVFGQMPFGQVWGALFFLFMSCAALSTVITVFEGIVAFAMDQWNVPRRRAALVCGALLAVLSIPCVLGNSVWSGFQIPGIGGIQGIEDFLVSNLILPVGGLILVLFCSTRRGWGFDAFLAEADEGRGMRFPRWARGYVRFVLPALIAVVLVAGLVPLVGTWLALA